MSKIVKSSKGLKQEKVLVLGCFLHGTSLPMKLKIKPNSPKEIIHILATQRGESSYYSPIILDDLIKSAKDVIKSYRINYYCIY